MRILVFGIFVSFFFVACGYVEQGVEIKKEYDEYGNLLNETPYKNGKRYDTEKRHRKDGALQYALTYKNDELISGKCGDGKIIANTDLERMRKDGFVLLDDELCP